RYPHHHRGGIIAEIAELRAWRRLGTVPWKGTAGAAQGRNWSFRETHGAAERRPRGIRLPGIAGRRVDGGNVPVAHQPAVARRRWRFAALPRLQLRDARPI